MIENNNPQQRIVTKSHLIFIKMINFVLLITIGSLLYELTKKDSYYYSYFLLGGVFVLKGISQYIYYKNNNTKKDLVLAIILAIIGISMMAFPLM